MESKKVKVRRLRAIGKLGGLKGGHARALKLSPERRVEIAKQAAATRWQSATPKQLGADMPRRVAIPNTIQLDSLLLEA